MIHSDFDWSRPVNWAILTALLGLLGLQALLLIRRAPQSGGRFAVRATLNGLLWLVLLGYVLQPVWQRTAPSTHALLVGDEVPQSRARDIQASLGISDRFTPRNFTGGFATVTLLGQTFSAELLSRLSGAALRWVRFDQPDKVESIRWKGIVRQGEMQRISGRIQSSQKQWFKLTYAGKTLDSTSLGVGNEAFTLQFPAFARGRTQLELTLGKTPLDTIRFFARPAEPMAYQFILDNPDFETKTLANWLGRMGQSVQLTSTVSTNVRNSLTINQPKSRVADVIITDPGNAANPIVKKAMAAGKRVLFINLTNPDADVRAINQALGSRFSLHKTGNLESVPVIDGISALPYQFNSLVSQQLVPGYPVAIQRTSGIVGVSLLNETFPLALSGDSTSYARLWYTLLAPLQTAGRSNVLIDAPVFRGLSRAIRVNNPTRSNTTIRIGTDTARLSPSPINPLSFQGTYRFVRAGWVPVADTLAVYVANIPGSVVGENQLVGAYVRAHEAAVLQTVTTSKPAESYIADWVWFLVMLSCFTALWVEPKLG